MVRAPDHVKGVRRSAAVRLECLSVWAAAFITLYPNCHDCYSFSIVLDQRWPRRSSSRAAGSWAESCLPLGALGRCLLLKQGCLAAGRPCRTAAPSTRVSESLAAAGIIRLPLMRDGSHANAYLSKEDFQMETGREGRQHPRLRRITADLSASLLHITTRICCRGW